HGWGLPNKAFRVLHLRPLGHATADQATRKGASSENRPVGGPTGRSTGRLQLPVSLTAASLVLSWALSAPFFWPAEPWSASPSALRSSSPAAAPRDSLARPPSSSSLFENLSSTPIWRSSRSRRRWSAPCPEPTGDPDVPPPLRDHDPVTDCSVGHRRERKNSSSGAAHSTSSAPPRPAGRWTSRRSRTTSHRDP